MAILKRLEAPGFWPIEKKTKKYTVATLAGPHAQKNSITLAVALREVLKYAETLREVRDMLNAGTVKVDGATRKKPGFPLGLMDVLSVGEENYRMLPGKHGLYLEPIDRKEAEFKLQKITGKATLKNRRTQLHFHDGKNIIAEGVYKTGDVAIFDLHAGKIRDIIKQEKGAKVVVIKGKNMGISGHLDSIRIVKSPEPNIVQISTGERKITLPMNYIFAIGSKESVISLGGKNG